MTDLSPLWIKQNLETAQQALILAEVNFCALKNKKSKYAKGIERMIEAQRKVVQVWREA